MPRVGKAGHRDPALEAEILAWIEAITGDKCPEGVDYGEFLKDGQVLCRLMNKLAPGSIKKIHESGAKYKFVENIDNFRRAMMAYGVSDLDVFQTPDLYEKKDLPAISNSILALGRQTYLHPEWKGPHLGPKPGAE